MIVFANEKTGMDNVLKLDDIGFKFTKLILFNAYEWEYSAVICEKYQGILKLIDIAKRNNIKLNIINGSAQEAPVLLDEELSKFCDICYYETFWLSDTHLNIRNDIDSNELDNDIQYKIISLNLRPHIHRCLAIDLLAKHNLIEGNAISWHQKFSHKTEDPCLPSTSLGYEFRYWDPKVLTLTEKKSEFNQFIIPMEYQKSFCQLVVESTARVPFLTEKTATSLFYMKPFLAATCKNYHKVLERMGFVLYDEIFDYSFDSIDDLESRFEGVMLNLKRINFLSFDELKRIQSKLYDKLLYNKQHAINLATKLESQSASLIELLKDPDLNFIVQRYN